MEDLLICMGEGQILWAQHTQGSSKWENCMEIPKENMESVVIQTYFSGRCIMLGRWLLFLEAIPKETDSQPALDYSHPGWRWPGTHML